MLKGVIGCVMRGGVMSYLEHPLSLLLVVPDTAIRPSAMTP